MYGGVCVCMGRVCEYGYIGLCKVLADITTKIYGFLKNNIIIQSIWYIQNTVVVCILQLDRLSTH